MRSLRTKSLMVLAATAVVGMLFNTTCASFASEQVFRTVDFCFLFDCQNGAFGGLIDPCPDPGTGDDSTINLFVDCPVVEDN